MLAPIPKKRKDGKSSFKALTGYLLYERDSASDEVSMRGDYLMSDNVISLETVVLEMGAVAAENPRCKDAVYHYILAWQEGENPTRGMWEEAVKKSLTDLGFAQHQYLAVAHNDTDAFHAHVVVNRVHPERYHAHYPKFSKLTLDKSIREIEAAQGWKESRGLYQWDSERLQAVKTSQELLAKWREEREFIAATGKAAKMEIYANTESLETYCQGQPAKDINRLLKKDTATWSELHETLKKHGLAIHAGEKGGYTVSALEGSVHVKASKVFRATFAGAQNRALLAKKLGDFSEPGRYVKVIQNESSYKRTREPLKRDPHMRAARREARAEARKQLREEYIAYKQQCYKKAMTHTEVGKKMAESLKADYWHKRLGIRQSKLTPELKKAARSVLAMQVVQMREQLRSDVKAKRDEEKPKPYVEWVGDKAMLGDEAAISQLRGFQYAEKKRKRRMLEEEAKRQQQWNSIQVAYGAGAFDPVAVNLPGGVTWEVNRRTGDVAYKIAGDLVFTDYGNRIDVLPAGQQKHGIEIEVALKLAQQKYGNTLTLTGDDMFKRRCLETVVKNRMAVSFTDPALNQLKRQLEQQRDIAQTKDRGRGR